MDQWMQINFVNINIFLLSQLILVGFLLIL